MLILGPGPIIVCINDEPRWALIYFMVWSPRPSKSQKAVVAITAIATDKLFVRIDTDHMLSYISLFVGQLYKDKPSLVLCAYNCILFPTYLQIVKQLGC